MVIQFYVPTNHRQEKYEKRFGKFANFTPERLRGRLFDISKHRTTWQGDYDSDDGIILGSSVPGPWRNAYPRGGEINS